MTIQEELNEKMLGMLREHLKKGRKSLLVAVVADLDTTQYSQLVGYGVSMPLLEDAMLTSLEMLKLEIQKKQS